MRILAIGDIHGCLAALDLLLAAVQPQPEDTLVMLGDYVDRGPDSSGVLARLLALRETHYLVALRGNHEVMMLGARLDPRVRANWLEYGGDTTLASYGARNTEDLDAVPEAHWTFLEQHCLSCWEAETHFFVHANVHPDLPLWEQPPYLLYWERLVNPRPHLSGKIMVCGHTSQKSGLPLDLGCAICLDTWVYGNGWLTCMEIASGQIWQANQAGQQRQFYLQDLRHSTGEQTE